MQKHNQRKTTTIGGRGTYLFTCRDGRIHTMIIYFLFLFMFSW